MFTLKTHILRWIHRPGRRGSWTIFAVMAMLMVKPACDSRTKQNVAVIEAYQSFEASLGHTNMKARSVDIDLLS